MSRTTWIGGPLFASIAAGPVFSLALAVTLVVRMPASYGAPLTGFGVIFILSVPVGFILALPANIASAALLARIGGTCQPVRHPLAWAASGGALGWLIGAAVLGSFAGVPMTATGIACAMICRMLVNWPD